MNATEKKIEDCKIGDTMTICGYSDNNACKIVKRTAKTITVVKLKCKLLNGINSGEPDALQFYLGGFLGHTSGQQRWEIVGEIEGSEKVFRLNSKGKWKSSCGRTLIEGFHHYHDFNF